MPSKDRDVPLRGAVREAPDSDRISRDAGQRFDQDYGPGPGAPIVVVIAALNEVETVAGVVGAVSASLCGLKTDVLLIDDGSTDGTAARAGAAGALVCRLAVNLGQGQALRVGYHLARKRGATLIATMDADGQFDPAELPALIAPLAADEADFVTGSRRLGHSETTDPVRKAGLVVFAALVRALTGAAVTDPASGLRAFRVEIPEQVPLRQPQYQTAELLIGAIAHGYRVKEVAATVYPRAAGASKKGGNLAYGARFGWVLLSTWWASRPAARQHRRPSSPTG